MQVFPLKPNWASSVDVTLEFLTEIFESRNKTENRRAQRAKPRETINFQALTNGISPGRFSSMLRAQQREDFVFADPLYVSTASAEPIGSTEITVAGDPGWAAAGLIVVIEVAGARELVEISSVNAGVATLAAAIGFNIPEGATVYRGFVCRIGNPVAMTFQISSMATVPVVLEGRVGRNYVRPAAAPAETYRGLPVYDKKPNWATAVNKTFTAGLDLTDFGYGRRDYDVYLDFMPQTLRGSYLNRDAAFAQDMAAFFTYTRGRQGEFYAPSWLADIDPRSALLLATDRLPCLGSELIDMAEDPAYRDLYVLLQDGTRIYRRVTGYVAVGDNVDIVVDTPWDTSIELTDIAHIGWLHKSRFAVDALTLSWLTNTVSQATLAYQNLRADDDV